MLKISEHYSYYYSVDKHLPYLRKINNLELESDVLSGIKPICFMSNPKAVCLNIHLEENKAFIENSYYIGLDWISAWKMPVLVEPKLNDENAKLDHIQMLVEALAEPENLNHLEDLMEIKFDEEWIEVEGSQELQLTPFLIIQFLMTVRNITRKGLKKDYYVVRENLSGKVKGKILVGQQISKNFARNNKTNMICEYQRYGLDTEQNRFLKYVLRFLYSKIENFSSIELKQQLLELLRYNLGAFQQVKDIDFYVFRKKELNPFFKEYNVAIELGNQLLKLLDHNMALSSIQSKKYPPHWIDMSKLFELYVFKKLREQFPEKNAVKYHYKTNYQELDFIINTPELKAVVDAKYKPRYKSGNPSMEDARQLAGYARLNSVYRELGVEENQLIPVYVVYPSALKDSVTSNNDNQEEDFELITETSLTARNAILSGPVRKSKAYCSMFMQEVDLPVQHVVPT